MRRKTFEGGEPEQPTLKPWMVCGALIAIIGISICIFYRPSEYDRIVFNFLKGKDKQQRLYDGEAEAISREQQKLWLLMPEKITATYCGITAHLGTAPHNGDKERNMAAAAPFILCSLLALRPSTSAEKQKKYSIRIEWNGDIEGAGEVLENWLTYDRNKGLLEDAYFAPPSGHGTNYSGVTDRLLLQLYQDALRNSTTINLRRLIKLRCKAETY